MYLTKKHYVQNWNHQKDRKFKVTVKLNGLKHPAINSKKVTYVIEQVAYWRKANAIHMWFVNNCQNGKDECQEAYVDPAKLEKLLETCKEVVAGSTLVDGVIKNTEVAESKLPVEKGFFFGNTDYNKWYLDDIIDTIKILEKELSVDHGINSPEYYYRSSW